MPFIKPQKSKIFIKILDLFLDRKFKKSFSSVNYFFDYQIDINKSVLIVGNHSTWWDGFIAWQLNRKFFKKQFYVIMLETQLKKLWFFQKIGAFSINPGNRSVVETLNFTKDLLKNNESYLVFYPQGKLYSLYDESFTFSKGIENITHQNVDIQLIAYAFFIDFSSNEKPYLNIFIDVLNPKEDIEMQYKLFYQKSKYKHISYFKS